MFDILEADDLFEEDGAEACICTHGGAEHDDAGCRTCACGALCLDLSPEDLEDDNEADAARVTSVLVAAKARRRKLDEDREAAISRDPARAPRFNRSQERRPPKAPPAEPKVSRAATTKPAASNRQKISRVAARSPQPLPSYEDDGRIHFDEDALEAVLTG